VLYKYCIIIIIISVAGTEAYLRPKFHLDSSNHLATIHQRHRQTDRQTHRTDRTVVW